MFSKRDIALRLVGLRHELEYGVGGDAPDEWSFCLFDVCQQLELSDEQTRAVVGPCIWTLINEFPVEVS